VLFTQSCVGRYEVGSLPGKDGHLSMERRTVSQERDLVAENERLSHEAAAVDAVTAELLQLQDRDRSCS